jgi:hypothetical protein
MKLSTFYFPVLLLGFLSLVLLSNGYCQTPIISLADSLKFDTTFVGIPVSEDLTIQNIGNATLHIYSVYADNQDFTWNTVPDSIQGGAQAVMTIDYVGGYAGQIQADLTIVSNDLVNDTVRVVLSVYVLNCPPFPVNYSINVTVDEGDSLLLLVPVGSGIPQPLHWHSDVEYSDNIVYPTSDLGDTLFALDMTQRTPTIDENLRGVTYDGNHIWIAGANATGGVPLIYQFDKSGNFIQYFTQPPLPANPFGFSELGNDGLQLYGDLNNQIYVFDLNSGLLLNVVTLSALSRIDAFAVDRYSLDFWATSWSSDIYQFDSQGFMLAVFPYAGAPIGGLGLEPFATGPLHLWAWTADGPSQGPMCTAMRLDNPSIQFLGVDMNGDSLDNDLPAGIDIVRWDNTLTMLALQQSNHLPGDGHDFLVGYSLGHKWKEWLIMDPDSGVVPACTSVNIAIKIYGILGVNGETERMAIINFETIDPQNPLISWDVSAQINPATSLTSTQLNVPVSSELYQNYPNPFNAETIISISISEVSVVSLDIITPLGQQLKTLYKGILQPGLHRFLWNGRNGQDVELASGIYLCRFTTGNQVLIRKLLLTK